MTAIIDPTTGYTLRPIDIERDAEGLAAMWNASDDQWPGTRTKGVPMTAQRVREWYANENAREVWVWDTGTAIAGYCSFWDEPDVEDATYIATLNVAPQFQKASLGRKFLTHFVRRATEIGSVQLNLGTWSGNLKAVPLYKKCGFFWTPGTTVWMQNFLPTVLRLPVAEGFFARHDWYTSMQRELTQREDEELWQGMKVFTYRFAAGGETLTVWIDREARTVTAIETDHFRVAAIADTITPPKGLPTSVRWELANKSREVLAISLATSGSDDLRVSKRATLELAPGETRTLEASVDVAATADEKKEKAAPAVKTLLVVGGQVVELGTGLRPRPAVEVATFPQRVTLAPGVAQMVELQLRSRLKEPVAATISLAPQEGLVADWSRQQMTLEPDVPTALAVRLQADGSGVYTLPVGVAMSLEGREVVLPVATQQIFALAPGGVLAVNTGEAIRVENETVCLEVARRGAGLTFFERASGEWVAGYDCYSTPPAWPSEFMDRLFDLTLERLDGALVVTAVCDSRSNPGLRFSKRITVGSGPLFSVACEVTNLGESERQVSLRQWFSTSREETELTLPLARGLTRGRWEVFPNNQDDDAKLPATFGERWAAMETDTLTVGMVWADDQAELEWAWVAMLVSRQHTCAPGGRVRFPTLHLYAGAGDWRAVQQLWARLNGTRVGDETPRPPVDLRLDPPLLATANGQIAATLELRHQLSRPLAGRLSLELPAGWQSDTGEVALEGVTWQRPAQIPLSLHHKGVVGAASGRVLLAGNEGDRSFQLPLIRLGDGRNVAVCEGTAHSQTIWTIDNGLLQLDVTPSFGGTVSSLRSGGVELLASPFPEVATIAWMSPWYGGLMPLVIGPEEGVPGKVTSERFSAAPVAWEDRLGNRWMGVRQRATVSNEHLRGLEVEIDTLTLGGSPLVRHTLRLVNRTAATRRVKEAGWLAFVQPGGSRAQTTVWGADAHFKASERITWVALDHWAAAQNPTTGDTLALVTPIPDAWMSGWGAAGGHLAVRGHPTVPANGAIELTGYLALATTLDEARVYAALGQLG